MLRRYRNFHILHKALSKYVHSMLGMSVEDVIKRQNLDPKNLPKLPLPSDLISGLNKYSIHGRKVALETYLNMVLVYPKFRDHSAMREFLDVSVLSFIACLGPRYKEGLMKKRPIDAVSTLKWWKQARRLCTCRTLRTQLKWFSAKESCLTYFRPDNDDMGFPMLIDRGFKFMVGFRHTMAQYGLTIENLQKKLFLKAVNSRELQEWVDALNQIMEASRCFLISSRFNSFAPVRSSCSATWFIDGRSYMDCLCDAISTAKEQIFITDWWLSPEIKLRRFKNENETLWRLDELLAQKANEGIRIYVLLFKEVRLALSIDSLHSKTALRSRNPKFIKVIRHPDKAATTLLWSHHEKSVVIDQSIAFVGGIDLCFGRWEDNAYRLVDLGSENNRTLFTPEELAVPSVASTTAGTSEEVFANYLLERSEPQRNDSTVNGMTGRHLNAHSAQSDMSRKRSKWHEVRQVIRRHEYRDMKNIEDDSEDEESADSGSSPFIPYASTVEAEIGDELQDRIWLGKDYSNSYLKDFTNVKEFYTDNLDRKTQPRMPWHDEHAVVLGDAALDVARHFIQRWNQAKYEKHRDNINYPYLLPKAYPCIPSNDLVFKSLYPANVQVLRSVGSWSAGLSIVESSIMTACCHLIESARHYVLIENQFFITSTSSADVVKNGIGKAIFERIARAHWSNENFKIYVILPLLPGFDAKEAIQAIQHFTMRSISVGEHCLFNKLRTEGGVDDPLKYISFYGMRNWDILMGKLVTEIIYVHSKLMIADDIRAVVGSANINDRSLLGPRDSEMALAIEDTDLISSYMNGVEVKVGKMCSSWRKAIFSQALGLHNDQILSMNVNDPVSDSFYNQFRQIARTNTETYLEVFGCIPNDEIRSFADLKQWRTRTFLASTNPNEALETLRKKIQGYIVELPLYFLYDEDYYPLRKTKEGLAPYIMWT